MVLFKILRKVKQREKEIRVLILGLDNAGKTTCVKKFNGEDTSTISPTLGFNIKTLQYEKYRLNIWDVGGQKSLRPFWKNYFEKTDAIVWVVDSTDKERLQACKTELGSLLQEERLAGASLLVLANKQDLPDSLPPEKIRDILELDKIKSSRHWHIQQCSAIEGAGLLPGVQWLVKDVAARLYLFD
eukprot:TRINITY_DN21978_c0_g1_i1.p1 TRINITY_DN21978_c0_g1~~TRINITY_DN21978_c0_g1_i1.p1  ORF type:complete len:186 (-),score=25.32 TRINITY_DN21978_c0_g1_i1:172-729(-)